MLEDLLAGLGREPLLLGVLLSALILLFASGVHVGMRRAWVKAPVGLPSPTLVRAVAALQPVALAKPLNLLQARAAVGSGQALLFSLHYEVRPEKRQEYLGYMDRLRDHLVRDLGYTYAVWEEDGRPSWFTEMILCTTPPELERLTGPEDSLTHRLLAGLNQFLRDPGKVQRATLMGMPPASAPRTAGEPAALRQAGGVLNAGARSVPIPRPAYDIPPGELAHEPV